MVDDPPKDWRYPDRMVPGHGEPPATPITGPTRPVTWEADYCTWLPVAFFRLFDVPRQVALGPTEAPLETGPNWVLHQLWCTPLGQMEWRKVEQGRMREWTKAYAECQVFNESPDEDLPF